MRREMKDDVRIRQLVPGRAIADVTEDIDHVCGRILDTRQIRSSDPDDLTGVRGEAIDDPAADEAGRPGHGNRPARQ